MSPQASWTQSWPYAQATKKIDHYTTRLALLTDDQKNPIGMVAVQIIQFWIFQFINIKRGPIWFSKALKAAQAQFQTKIQTSTEESRDEVKFNHSEAINDLECEFALALQKEFPRRLISRLRWTMSRPISKNTQSKLNKLNFRLTDQNFITDIVDLRPDLPVIRKALKQKWRNSLNKAESSALDAKIYQQQSGIKKQISEFCLNYEKFKSAKKFVGPSARFLFFELMQAALQTECVIVVIEKNKVPVAAGAFTISGKTISYRAAWLSDHGREFNASYLVLWSIIKWAKSSNLENFDLGGVLPNEAPGLTHFKSGLNGERIELPTFS